MKYICNVSSAILLMMSSSTVIAADIADDMNIIVESIGVLQSSTRTDEILSALDKMQSAAENAKKSVPHKLYGKSDNTMALVDYQQGLDKLIVVIDKSRQQVKSGDIQLIKE
ncbi:cytochrome B562, partial [Salmonella enterica]|nr:cytochrome B562 [Salmonella enterica]